MPFISTSNTSESTSRRQSSSSKTHLLRFHFVFSSSSLLLSCLLSGISYIHTYCIWVETQNKHIMQLCSYPLLNSMSYMRIVYVYVFKLLKCHLHWTLSTDGVEVKQRKHKNWRFGQTWQLHGRYVLLTIRPCWNMPSNFLFCKRTQ